MGVSRIQGDVKRIWVALLHDYGPAYDHVIAVILVLATLTLWSALGYFDRRRSAAVNIGMIYWHFVDAVWLVVFLHFLHHATIECGLTMAARALADHRPARRPGTRRTACGLALLWTVGAARRMGDRADVELRSRQPRLLPKRCGAGELSAWMGERLDGLVGRQYCMRARRFRWRGRRGPFMDASAAAPPSTR